MTKTSPKDKRVQKAECGRQKERSKRQDTRGGKQEAGDRRHKARGREQEATKESKGN